MIGNVSLDFCFRTLVASRPFFLLETTTVELEYEMGNTVLQVVAKLNLEPPPLAQIHFFKIFVFFSK